MPTKVRYTGPYDEVEVPEAGIVCERLRAYEVETSVAERLLEQDVWERPPSGPGRPAAKAAAAKPLSADAAPPVEPVNEED